MAAPHYDEEQSESDRLGREAEGHFRVEATRIVGEFLRGDAPRLVGADARQLRGGAAEVLRRVAERYLGRVKPEDAAQWLCECAARGARATSASWTTTGHATDAMKVARQYDRMVGALQDAGHHVGMRLQRTFKAAIVEALMEERPDLVLVIGEKLRTAAPGLSAASRAVVSFALAQRIDPQQTGDGNLDPAGTAKSYRTRASRALKRGKSIEGTRNYFVPMNDL